MMTAIMIRMMMVITIRMVNKMVVTWSPSANSHRRGRLIYSFRWYSTFHDWLFQIIIFSFWYTHSAGTQPLMMRIKLREWLKMIIMELMVMIMTIIISINVMIMISTSSCSVCEWLKVVRCLRARTSFRWRRVTDQDNDGDDHGDHDENDGQEEK